jgi:hypothetical protein
VNGISCQSDVSSPLTHAEKVAILGREPYAGDWDGYLKATGREVLGGDLR